MPRKRASRIYTRTRGGERRYYADFRYFVDVGGRQEALIAPGEHHATVDPDVAEHLATERVKELEARRRGRALHGVVGEATLSDFAREHLIARKKAGRVADDTLAAAQLYLERAIEYLGADRELGTITVRDVREWLAHLQTAPQRNRRSKRPDRPLSPWSARHHLNALSSLYRRAGSEGYVLPGFNPAAAVIEKPRASRKEEKWLEVHEAALFLEVARTNTLRRRDSAMPYVFGADRAPSRLLFPSQRTALRAKREDTITDCRKLLDTIGVRWGWKRGEIRTKMFRHTYCAARLQTLDHGAPVSIYTVSREMGHGSTSMVERVYSHLGQVRHRSEQVEYRIDQHAERLADRLSALGLAP